MTSRNASPEPACCQSDEESLYSGPPMLQQPKTNKDSKTNSRPGSGIFPVKSDAPDKKFEIPDEGGLMLPDPSARRLGKAITTASKCSSAKLRRSKRSLLSGKSERILITQHHSDDDDDSDIFGTRESGLSDNDFLRDDEDGSDFGSDDNSFIMAPAEVDIENDDDFDTDVEFDEQEFLSGEEKGFDPSGVKDYIRECNKLGVIPVSYFQRHIKDKAFVMKYHGLGPLGAKAIAKPLENNTFIEKLNLQGNCIEAEGALHVAKALRENLYISELNLAENNLRTEGCKLLCEVLSDNTTVHSLTLSGNKLKDRDGEYVHNLLINNQTIRKLNLDHNEFETVGARWIKDALLQNENLKILDLSWNRIRLKGAEYIGEMIQENYGLKYLDMTMNGLSDIGAKYIGHALLHNQCLLELNISDNRITRDGAICVAKGLIGNDELATLRIGFNTIGLEGALALLMGFDKNESPGLSLLDMTNVIVPDAFEKLQEKMAADGKNLEVIHGGVLYMQKRVIAAVLDPEETFDQDPMTKLKKYAAKQKMRLIDLFRQFDVDNSWTVSREEFIRGVSKENSKFEPESDDRINRRQSVNRLKKATGLDLSEADIDLLISKLDQDGDGEIDYGELVEGDKVNRLEKFEMLKVIEDQKKRDLEAEMEEPIEEDEFANIDVTVAVV